jgi:heme exporter protein D
MQWNDIGEFLAMGGRAFYVWGSFGACLLLMVAEPILAQRRARAVRDTLRRERLADELDRNRT